MSVTQNVSAYIQEKGISVLRMCEKTGLSYKRVKPSLSSKGSRELRASEFMTICNFIGVDPKEFDKFTNEGRGANNDDTGESS